MSSALATREGLRTFAALCTAWEALLQEVKAAADGELRVYMWQPRSNIQAPALFNWLLPSTFQVMDTARGRDTINLVCRIGLAHTDEGTDMARMARYVDAYRSVVDPALWTPHSPVVLGDTAYRAQRNGMQMESLDIGGVPLLCIGFNMAFDQDRRIG